MLLENAQQLYLHVGRHVADLIQKDRSPVRELEAPDSAIGRAGESSLLMTKQFTLDETDWKRRTVHLDQRPIPALAVRVHGARYQFFSSTGLPENQHRRIRARDEFYFFDHLGESPALSDHLLEVVRLLDLFDQVRVLSFEARLLSLHQHAIRYVDEHGARITAAGGRR